jgi:phospholipid/cholesterol/gamma-HCH transport system permease protein
LIKFPKNITNFFVATWDLWNFAKKFFIALFRRPVEIQETIRQCFAIGYKSLPLVSITGFIIGLTLALQIIPTLDKFGAVSLIPQMLSIAIVREIGPVIIGLICAGKMGSGIGAELGSMKVTEQIDAMEVSAINPFKYLVVTRVMAAVITVPILVIYADTLGLFGGYLAMSVNADMTLKLFFSTVFETLTFEDVLPATIKTFFFGFGIGLVGSYKGFNCSRGTESVGIAANSSVVLASLLVILMDLIAVQISSIIF